MNPTIDYIVRYGPGSNWVHEHWCRWHKRWEGCSIKVDSGYMTALMVE